MPRIIRKLRGAGIVGRDVNKPDRPEVAEMGGLGVFLGFNVGVFAFLVLAGPAAPEPALVLVALITAAGATMTGILDDLVVLRQRFKAFIPVVFAAPLAVYVDDYSVWLPFAGSVDFGLLYPLVLVPLGVTCASNGFNMLEGYNGLGAGIGVVLAVGLAVVCWIAGAPTGLVLLLPLLGGLLAFLRFNWHPAKVFPGDTMTLLVGAVLAAAAILSKVEFWGLLLFLPHVVEFAIKMRNGFPSKGWWGEFRGGKLHCPPNGPVGLGQWTMRVAGGITERRLVATMLAAEAAVAAIVVGLAAVVGA
ncbi:MAG TPA: hypothetical protein VHH36_09790 [Candidatus Thermoplasmatota archaeon]|nr:hypothetical protein [Candidatus Thermoplasmatota archaeon]